MARRTTHPSTPIKALLCGLCLAPTCASAQDILSSVQGVIGLGAGSAPTFPGSDDAEVEVLPIIDLEWNDRYFLSTERGLGFYALRRDDEAAEYGIALSLGYDFDQRDLEDDRLGGADPLVSGEVAAIAIDATTRRMFLADEGPTRAPTSS